MNTASIVSLLILFILLMPIAAGKKQLLPFIVALLITFFSFYFLINKQYKNTPMQVGTIISIFIIVIIFGTNNIEESWLLTIFYLTILYGTFSYYGLFSI